MRCIDKLGLEKPILTNNRPNSPNQSRITVTRRNDIMKKSEKELIFEIDIAESEARTSSSKFQLKIKSSSRKMFLSGEWDATSTLLKNLDLIEEKIKRLPYVKLNDDFSA